MQLTTAILADDAAVLEGKLYVFGGGWDSIQVAAVPTMVARVALALVVRVEYSEALRDIPISIELLDEDDHPLGPRVEGVLNVGHAPRTRPGTPAFASQALRFEGLRIEAFGGYRFRVSSDDVELASVPFRVHKIPGLR